MNSKKHLISANFSCISDIFFFVCGIIMLISEVWKQLILTFVLGGGSYNWWYFPFQLCSIPMYVLLAYPWLRRKNARLTLLAFLMCYCLLGGIAVFADTSGLHYPLPALTVHSYLWHIVLILLGITAGITYIRRLHFDRKRTLFSRALSAAFPLRPFIYCTCLYLACCLIAELLNLSLDKFGTINMFYINPDYRMQQVVFRDLLPIIGNTGTILLYIASTILGAFLLYLFWKLVWHLTLRSRNSRGRSL